MGTCGCSKDGDDHGHVRSDTHITDHRPSYHTSKRPTTHHEVVHHVETHEGSSTHEEHHTGGNDEHHVEEEWIKVYGPNAWNFTE
jgi:hypothetical protein